MRQVLRVIAVTVAGGFLLAAVTPPATAGISGDRFQVTNRTISEHYNDVGRKGESIGDSFTFRDRLFNRGDRVGRDPGHCVTTRAGKRTFSFQCMVTLTLRGKGDITVHGGITFKRGQRTRNVLAVTGGTGDYAGASGVVRFVEKRGEPTRLRVRLTG